MSRLRRPLLIVVVLAWAGALAPIDAAAEPQPEPAVAPADIQYAAAAGASIHYRGAGFGHQVGMSQYGAYAMAAAGHPASDIVSFYYQGAAITTVEGGLGLISVNVRQSQPGVTVQPMGKEGGGNHAEIRVGRLDGDPLAVCPIDAFCTFTATNGRVVLEGTDVAGTRDQPIYVGITHQAAHVLAHLPEEQAIYSHGHLMILPTPSDPNRLNVVNVLDLDYGYTAGIAEVPSSWPAAVLDAQAIAARTYAYQRHRGGECDCDVVNDTFDQVYVGWEKEKQAAWAAAAARTRGQIITYNGQKISALYSSSTGGRTEANEDAFGGPPVAYLRSIDDPWSLTPLNPLRSWLRSFDDLEAAPYLGLDRVTGVVVTAHTQGGSIARAMVSGVKGGRGVSVEKTGSQLRFAFSLPSTRADVTAARPFDEYLLLYNPNPATAHVDISLLLAGGEPPVPVTMEIPAGSRRTVHVNEYAPMQDVSMSVKSDVPVVAERAMYFLHRGEYSGGHASEGVTAPSPRWLLAEGYVAPNFETYVLVANPGDVATTARLRLFGNDGRSVTTELPLAARSRGTVLLNDVAGFAGGDVSVEVTADAPVVAERAVYFDYTGLDGTANTTGGHNAPGVTNPANTWYLPEGYTAEEFDTYVLLENPGDLDAHTTVTFLRPSGEPVVQQRTVPARTRMTIVVDQVPGLEATEVSTEVVSDVPIVAERSMYFEYFGGGDGHDAQGLTTLSTTWYLTEGFASPTFDTYVLVANPDPARTAVIDLEYHQTTGHSATRRVEVPPRSRRTVKVDDDVTGDVSTVVISRNGVPVAAERAMYFDYLGLKGGTDAVGVAAPSNEWFFAEGYTGT